MTQELANKKCTKKKLFKFKLRYKEVCGNGWGLVICEMSFFPSIVTVDADFYIQSNVNI